MEFFRTYRVPLLVFIFGLLISGLAYGALKTLESERLAAEFETIAEVRAQHLKNEMVRQEELLRSVARLYRSSQEVTSEEFQQYLEGADAAIKSLVAVAWVPRVTAAERRAHEARLIRRGPVPGQISEKDSAGRWVVAGQRADYFPATYILSTAGESDPVGFDLGSSPVRRSHIEKAIRDGVPVVTPQVSLLVDTALPGYIVFQPVIAAGVGPRGGATGVLAGVFSTSEVILATCVKSDPFLSSISLRDVSDTRRLGVRLHLDPSGNPGPVERAEENYERRTRGPVSINVFHWGGRPWEVECRASPFFVEQSSRHDAFFVFLLGFLVNVLFSLYLAQRSTRRAAAAAVERERAKRLESRQQRLILLGRASATEDLAESLGDLCAAAAACLEADCASAWLVMAPGRHLVCRAVSGGDAHAAATGTVFDLDSLPAYAASLASGTHVAIRDATSDPMGPALSAAGMNDARILARLDIPVRRGGALAGVLCVGMRSPRDWTSDDVALASSLAELFVARLEENERRQAETALRESRRMLQRGEARLRLTIDQAPIGIASLTRDGRFVRVNRALATVLGLPAESLVGQSLLENVSETDRLAVGSVIARLASGDGAARDLEFHVQRSGAEVVVMGRFAAVREQEGQTGELVVQLEDVTDRKRSEKALRESEARYRSIFESGADALVLVNADGIIRGANPRACELHGWSGDEMRGMRFERLIAPGMRTETSAALAAARHGRAYAFESEDVRRDGTVFPVEIRMSPFMFEAEAVLLCSIRDTSERRAADEEKKRLLAQEHEARARAEQAVRARDTFLSVASHELRTPLTVLQLNLQGLARTVEKEGLNFPEAERLKQFAEAAVRQGDRLNRFLDVLLDTTRIASGQFGLKVERVDLVQVVRDVVERLHESAQRARCPIELRVPDEAWGSWDRFRLEQVATNLLTNAMRYGFGKPVVVVVESDGVRASLEVRDQGIGISASDQARIFRKYERVSSGPHRGGLGLGLYIVREIVEAHQGKVEVVSEVGAGSTFRVTVPVEGPKSRPESGDLNPDEAAVPEQGGAGQGSGDEAQHPLSPQTGGLVIPSSGSGTLRHDLGLLMVVEDDGDIRQLMVELVMDAGYTALQARDGREALEILAAGHRPKLILLDLMMPVMDGQGFRRAQLESAAWASIPVILVSADQRARERCHDLRFSAFLSKPVRGEDLLSTVAKVLGRG